MSNKIFLLISFLVIAFSMAGIYSYLSELNMKDEKIDSSVIAKLNTDDQKTSISKVKPIKESNAPSKDKHHEESLLDISTTKNLSILNVWFELEPAVVIPDIHLDDRIIIDKKLGVHTEYLSMINVGHLLEIPNAGNNRYLIKLTDKKKTGKKYELHGEFESQGRIFFSNFSISKNNIYGLIETPEGEFNLRMSKGQGYLYKADQLDKFTENRNRPDVITDIPGFLD
ncbi:MAG: Unknown protein [uncultured Thiotrichaceae bacterium]|uniref:Uncharacterized protein n=1 Tax=uncultured Thiotrichaceae bacterium TaxID=298394 RepID=A0A6S6SVG4_9GAMM|nr:MAG: Unknown protein [uncultured Thiotrichaceae bacterium]